MKQATEGQFPTGLTTLDARYYTSTEIFAAAREKVFFNSWQFVCHESQVAAVGDYWAFSLFDQDLFIARGKDNQLRCFYNVCKHRGHTLVEGSGNKRVVVCPYHAWTYELSGELRGAPGTKGLAGLDLSGICLTEVALDTLFGFVFINMNPAPASLATTFPGVAEDILALCPDIAERKHANSVAIEKQANWLVAVENYNECYHCKHVHPTFASGVIDPGSYNIYPFVQSDGTAVRCLRHAAKAQTSQEAWYDTSGSDYGSFYLWPAFSLQIYPSGVVNSYHWRPLAVDRTEVHRGWYSNSGQIDEVINRVITLDRQTTVAEDAELVKNVQRGLNSRGYRPGPLVLNPEQGIESEHSIAALHNWVRADLGEFS